MTLTPPLRARAEEQAASLPPLLARAEHLAGTVLLGEHGRRRAGMGDDFWQYRPVQPGDSRRMIDWRRSARGDAQYVREREWQIAQSVMLWIDDAQAMRFSSDANVPQKLDRGRILALATAILLLRGGERVGLSGRDVPPRRGEAQIMRIAQEMSRATSVEKDTAEYGAPDGRGIPANGRALFVSDFLGDLSAVETALTSAADRGVRGVLLQVLDPQEEGFPFHGRTIFESMGQGVIHETLKADGLRDRYLVRLAERKSRLAELAALTGWQYHCHHTDGAAQSALLWLYRALEQRGSG